MWRNESICGYQPGDCRKKLKSDPDLRFMYRLAKDLGRTVEEVMEMTTAEFVGWVAFYKQEAEQEKQAMNKAKMPRR